MANHLPPQTEKAFQAQVIQLAKAYGWRYYHTHDSRRSVEGFPDLVLVSHKRSPARLVFAELKAENGRLTDAQRGWHHALVEAGQEVYLWKPRDMDEIIKVLGR